MRKFTRQDSGISEPHANLILTHMEALVAADYSVRLPTEWTGIDGEVAKAFNDVVTSRAQFSESLQRVFHEVGDIGFLDARLDPYEWQGRLGVVAESLNKMISNITSQARDFETVIKRVALGDLSTEITIEAHGGAAEIKHAINEMIRSLREAAKTKSMLTFLTSNLAKFNQDEQGESDLVAVSSLILSYLSQLMNVEQGMFYERTSINGEALFSLISSYSSVKPPNIYQKSSRCDEYIEQVIKEKKLAVHNDVPNDCYRSAYSSSDTKPYNVVLLPIVFNNEIQAIIEIASFTPYTTFELEFLESGATIIGLAINNIVLNRVSEEILVESLSLSTELLLQQQELQISNQELEEKTQLLEDQNLEVELRSHELEVAKAQIEARAFQLSRSSQYKSDFLSSMSHELRTPLNSLLILAELLASNPRNHLDTKEVEFAKLIHISGIELLALINNILDLSKIESGVEVVNLTEVPILEIQNQIEKIFRHVAEDQGLDFHVIFASDLPPVFVTDETRVQQVIRNLISNAFKFTKNGTVSIRVVRALSGWSSENDNLNQADVVLAFTVVDTGIGISVRNHEIIFEAFHQADTGTNRKYGGTGLGLSISREIASLLGGELKLVQSALGIGSTFTLFLPSGRTEKLVERAKKIALVPDVMSEDSKVVSVGVFSGKKVLIVDDDNRNIIALTAVLEQRGALVFSETSGRGAIDLLAQTPNINLVLMDIMMPEMDGYETIREIRTLEKFRELPIIAVTANAMVGDREKCIEAGASEYFSKPVDVEKLSAVMQKCFEF